MYFYFYVGLYLRNLNSSFFVSCIMLTCVSGMMCLEFQVQTSLLLFGYPVVSGSLGPMDHSTPGLSVLHHLLRFAQVYIHCIGDAIQPSHPLMSSSPAFSLFPASGTFPMSCLFASDDWNTGVSASPSIFPVSIQGWFPLRLTGLI